MNFIGILNSQNKKAEEITGEKTSTSNTDHCIGAWKAMSGRCTLTVKCGAGNANMHYTSVAASSCEEIAGNSSSKLIKSYFENKNGIWLRWSTHTDATLSDDWSARQELNNRHKWWGALMTECKKSEDINFPAHFMCTKKPIKWPFPV